MALNSAYDQKPVGVLGAGSFGTVIANILADRVPVILYARRPEVIQQIEKERVCSGFTLKKNIEASDDLQYVADNCEIIFPIVSSGGFRKLIRDIAPYLHPYHILIHGTKGLDVNREAFNDQENPAVTRDHVRTMSEVIRDESVVVRVGCLAGPNLARELGANQPAATVVASHFREVIQTGQRLLRNNRFQVYGSNDLIGVELAGVLKNIIAIASGALSGLGLGENARALLISRGMVEMIYLGKALGGNTEAFIGLAGVGDLVATCSSRLSRNYTVGYRLAQHETLQQITATMEEAAEGVNTIKLTKELADYYQVSAPITKTLFKVLFEDMKVEAGLDYLMKYPMHEDVTFL